MLTSIGLLTLVACGGGGSGTTPATTGTSPAASAPVSTPAPSHTESAGAESTEPPGDTCVEETFSAMSADQRLGQLLMIGLDTHAARESLDGHVRDQHVGNVIYLGGWEGFEKVSATSEHLQSLVSPEATGGVGLIIAADQEGGIVHQLRGPGFTRPPKAIDQAATMSPEELTAAATEWGREMDSAGVNLNLAPVADTVPTDVGTRNEPIGRWGRQFGSDPAVVAEYVPAFLRGMETAGVAGLVKHFPGLGRVTGNTDFTAEGIEDDVATVEDPFLEPFVAGMEAGAAMVMMSSAVYPKIDADHQALYSSAVVTGLLRERLGWDGVVITDDVNAAALADIPAGERAVRFIAAGGDIVLNGNPGATEAMIAALRTRAADDAEFSAQVDASVTRVLTLKDEMGLLPCSR